MTLFPQQHRVLVVDDEPDVLAVTRLGLRGMSFDGREVLLEGVESGKAAVAYMEQHPDTAVILLDVVMESDRAGLEACQHIRWRTTGCFFFSTRHLQRPPPPPPHHHRPHFRRRRLQAA